MQTEWYLSKVITGDNQSRASRSISIIATISLFISVLIMLLSVSAGLGLQRKIKDKLAAFSGNLIISSYENIPGQYVKPIHIQSADTVKSQFDFKEMQPFGLSPGIVVQGENYDGIVLKGYGEQFDRNNFQGYMVEGKIPYYQNLRFSDSILISSSLSKSLKAKLGDKLLFYFLGADGQTPLVRKFRVAGIYETLIQEIDENYIIGSLKHVQKINRWEPAQVSGIEIFLNDFDQITAVQRPIAENIDYRLRVDSLYDINRDLLEWVSIFDTNIYLIIGIMILVSTLNLVTLLLIFIVENTSFIAMLKTMGMNQWSLRRVFSLATTRLLLKSLLWANIVALLIVIVQQQFGIIQLDPQSYYVKEAPLELNLNWWIAINILTIVITYVMVMLPAIAVGRIRPSQVLRWE